MNVIILRGIPGSGKSTWIKQQFGEEHRAAKMVVCSADDYHVKDGRYEFKIEDSAASHLWCFAKYLGALGFRDVRKGAYGQESTEAALPETVVVDNTNCSAWEIAPYYQAAMVVGAVVQITRICCTFDEAWRRNVHGVPSSTIWRMYQTLLAERLPAHWREEIVLP